MMPKAKGTESRVLPLTRAHRRWIPRELSSSPLQTSGGQHRTAGSSTDRCELTRDRVKVGEIRLSIIFGGWRKLFPRKHVLVSFLKG